MAQLIKLSDYISRYEQDAYSYPSRFIRLKKKQWERLLDRWKNEQLMPSFYEAEAISEKRNTASFFSKISLKFSRKKTKLDVLRSEELEWNQNHHDEESALDPFKNSSIQQSRTEEELKQYFLDHLFRLQIKWASSTLTSQSFPDHKYSTDANLKYLLQRFPDHCLVLYHPIFLLKKAPFESETLIITPTAIWCISFLEEEENAVFVGSKEHFWVKKGAEKEKKILNPLVGLDRTEKVVKELLTKQGSLFPIKKAVLCRNGYLDYPSAPFGVDLIEKRNYPEWFEKMRSERAPIKSEQLKAAKVLLDTVQSIYSNRVEWS
ncbi:MAG TPA: NERD domain-containing protein [Bacillus sp. (in: firmicutes)]|nr:NERD domain-containing protein [Bacillus sp. (in: firmicutes)]